MLDGTTNHVHTAPATSADDGPINVRKREYSPYYLVVQVMELLSAAGIQPKIVGDDMNIAVRGAEDLLTACGIDEFPTVDGLSAD